MIGKTIMCLKALTSNGGPAHFRIIPLIQEGSGLENSFEAPADFGFLCL